MLFETTKSVLNVLRRDDAEWISALREDELSRFVGALAKLRDSGTRFEATTAAQEVLAFVVGPRMYDKIGNSLRHLPAEQLKKVAHEKPSAHQVTEQHATSLRVLSEQLLTVISAREHSSGPQVGGGGIDLRGDLESLSFGTWDASDFKASDDSDSLPGVQTGGGIRPGEESVRSHGFEAPGEETRSPQLEESPPPVPAPRFLVGRMSNEVQVGQRVPLQVRIGLTPSGGSAASLQSFLVLPGTAVTLDVYSAGFSIRSDATQTLIVPIDKDSDWARFEMEARTPGNQTVEVNAWNNGAFLGTLTLAVTVTTQAAQGQPTETTGGLGMRKPSAGEVTLDVQYDPDKKQYRYQLRGDAIGVLEPFLSRTFPDGRDAQFTQLITQMNQQAKNLQNYSPGAARDWLIGVGTLLWDDLMPQPLKEAFWQNVDKIQRLNIVSPADPLPWEMVCPFQDGKPETALFLADRFSVSRWTYGRPPSATLNIGDPYFVLPPDAPPSAPAEVQALRTIVGNAGAIEQLDALINLIKSKQFGLLHFATHNVQHDGGLTDSYIPLDGQRFSQAFLGPLYRETLRERTPLVFMNACTAAGTSPTYTGMTSWANCFLNAGAGAFLGSLWEVRDRAAREFSVAFYSTLKEGKTLADAMQAGRGAITDKAGDPTWLAYTLYGDPNATLASA